MTAFNDISDEITVDGFSDDAQVKSLIEWAFRKSETDLPVDWLGVTKRRVDYRSIVVFGRATAFTTFTLAAANALPTQSRTYPPPFPTTAPKT